MTGTIQFHPKELKMNTNEFLLLMSALVLLALAIIQYPSIQQVLHG